MNITVTGYTGFVGANLTAYLLKQGHQVTGIGRGMDARFHFEQKNYSELAGINNCDAIIHLAGKAHDIAGAADEKVYFEINTDLTSRVFDHFLSSKAKVFIYMSSVKAAADSVDGILTETDEPKPLTAYGQSKLRAEQYLLSKQLPEGKRVYILRPCMIHGPGNKGNLNLLHKLVKAGIPYPLAGFKNQRSLLSIDNLLFAIDGLLNNKHIASGIYNIADDEPLSTNTIIDVLASALNKKALKLAVNSSLIQKIAAIGTTLHLPLNTHRLQKLTESYVVDNRKIKQALGISNFPVSSTDGLHYTAINF